MPENVEALNVTQNGTYTAQEGHGYSPVTINVDVGFEPDDFADGSVKTSVNGNITLSTATKIAPYAFYGYTGITSITAPNVTSIGSNALNGCSALTSFIGPKVTSLTASQFKSLANLVTANLDSISSINSVNEIFRDCTKLENVSLPKLRLLYAQAMFYGCTALEYLVLPSLGRWYSGVANTSNAGSNCRLGGGFLYGCTSLKAFDIYTSYKFDEASIFANCSVFDTLIIRNLSFNANTVPTLANINSFTGTPFASNGTGGTIYVPSRYISMYQSATNWSTLLGYTNNQILPIEGSYYETHYADGTAIPTTTYTEVSFTRADGRVYSKEDGSSISDTTAHGSNYVDANDETDWQILTTTNPSGKAIYIQQFNENTCIKVSYLGFIDRRVVDGTDYYALNFSVDSNCTKFRFSLSGNAIPEKLYTVTQEA